MKKAGSGGMICPPQGEAVTIVPGEVVGGGRGDSVRNNGWMWFSLLVLGRWEREGRRSEDGWRECIPGGVILRPTAPTAPCGGSEFLRSRG